MKKIIFAATYLLCMSSIIITVFISDNIYYNEASRQTKTAMNEMIKILDAAVIGVCGTNYLDSLKNELENFRITLIDANGEVIFDNERNISDMDKHNNRKEIIQARRFGQGEAVRISESTKKETIYIAKRLNDNKILRISVAQNDKLVYPSKFMPIIIIIVAIFSIIIFFITRIITQIIVKPINNINLESPEDIYEELSPLLKRMNEQNDTIAKQFAKLRKRKNQFEIIASNMHEGLLILDKERLILHCNRSAKTILGCNDNNLIGQNVVMLCRNAKFLDALQNAENFGDKQDNSFESDGKTIEVIANPIIISNKMMGLTVLLVDISEKSDREKLRREFSANVSHELKTPLSVISGYSELICSGMVKSDDILGISKKIYDESQHLLTLINDIIQISNLDEKVNLSFDDKNMFDTVNLFDFVESAVKTVQKKAEERNISINITAPAENSAIIRAIPRFLDEIIVNLLDNAIKYNKDGGTVSINISKEYNLVVLRVKDTGIGIANSHQSRVFERFYRVDSSRSGRNAGTGLGLSIVKHAVQLNKGAITLSSIENEGTIVTVFFPRINND